MMRNNRIILTTHFIDNYKQRVGHYPEVSEIRNILEKAVQIQVGKRLKTENGNDFTLLSIYWSPLADVVLFIDDFSHVVRAISVLSKKNTTSPELIDKELRHACNVAYIQDNLYTPMTRHELFQY